MNVMVKYVEIFIKEWKKNLLPLKHKVSNALVPIVVYQLSMYARIAAAELIVNGRYCL
jgi:hypothetical protein